MTLTAEDLQRATQAKSDQLNSCDLLGGPIVAKILEVKPGSSEQPVIIVIDSWNQPWKPSKTSLRVLSACWGGDPSEWIGRYAVLYCDEAVTFGKEAIGGIRTSHLSHISGTKRVAVNTTRGKKGIQVIEPYYPQEESAPVNAEPVFWPDEAFAKRLASAQDKIDSGELTTEAFIVALEKKAPMTAGQKARVKPTPAPVIEDDGPPEMEEGDPFGMHD